MFLNHSAMNSNYKRLGEFITEVEERNTDLSVKLSQGICNLKYFQDPRQVAENSKNDKIVRKGIFAYNRATTRNGEKISIAYREGEDCTVSSSYLTFKINDEEKLNPYYLMMWFKRPEFDRYARFKSHGSAHEYFEWDEMCDVLLPVPPIEEQRRIVAEYQAIEQRIESNRQLIAKLEQTAQTIYRKMFVVDIDPENLPLGWRMGTIGEITDCNTDSYSSKEKWEFINYLDSSSVTNNEFDSLVRLNVGIDEIPSRAKRKVYDNDIIFSTVRPNLRHYGLLKGKLENVLVSTAFAVIRSKCKLISNELIYMWITDETNLSYLQGVAEMSKATYPSIVPDDILNLRIAIPDTNSQDFVCINKLFIDIFDAIAVIHKENDLLSQCLVLQQTKLSKN
jgi:type I restriction enzyme S subunit